MSRDGDRQRVFTRRALLMAGGQSVLLSILAGRLYYLQVVEASHYATLADDNRINLRLLPPPRGRINDRLGRPLAVNRQNYRVVLVAEQIGNVEELLDSLAQVIPVSERRSPAHPDRGPAQAEVRAGNRARGSGVG